MTTHSNKYPFPTKKEIAARLEADGEYRKEALLVIYERQTTDEQADKTTRHKNARGFMSSHAVNGCALAQKVQAGEELTEEEEGKVEAIVCRYTKQLAADAREKALAENPDLAEQGKVFGVC